MKHFNNSKPAHPSLDYCPHTNKLDNHLDCPSFHDVCHENEPCGPYYRWSDNGFRVRPIRHWCLMGEIEQVSFFIRPRLVIRTRFDERINIYFYLDKDHPPTTFSFDDAVIGNTIIIMYAEKHDFRDMSTGIRQEVCDSVVIFKCSMQQLIKIFASMMANPPACFQCHVDAAHPPTLDASEQKTHPISSATPSCNNAGSQSATENHSLKVCAKCRIALYCNRSCQTQHWKDNHRNLCSSMKYLQQLRQLDFTLMNITPDDNCQFFAFD